MDVDISAKKVHNAAGGGKLSGFLGMLEEMPKIQINVMSPVINNPLTLPLPNNNS